ncbi:MarR family transcriptional regulator [Salinibacterium sp. UTAS2018]|uniref:MarR family winged helix-turn-helix transcriptional regulator n=1 Tax=Salinibacterium sp. UTAS2018 TaxID=2508880 RepID=UPI00100979EA|nr:MarR family winged helix-turn-helix transcriptional regulator [Salinibacterium sp. UTAS2018]QAV70611.1 MarR family transcriptional regulator [Salinibacterium sp. UTAS2018]
MTDISPASAFDDEKLETWAALATLLEWLPAALDSQMQRDSDLTHFEYGIMFALSDAADCTLRMSTLATYSNSSLSRLSRAVARLETKNWVCRVPDPGDGRYTLASLTDRGREKVEQATPGHVDLVSRLVFDTLTPTQTRQLHNISLRITSAIRADGSWQP